MPVEFFLATRHEHYEAAKHLFREYAAHIRVDLCFQNFEKELEEITGQYGSPTGGIILCKSGNEITGCAGIRRIDKETGELKRMYIKLAHHGKGWGKQLLERSLQLAKQLKYSKVRLDTLPSMEAAHTLYKQAGFVETPAYYHNPNAGVIFMEKTL